MDRTTTPRLPLLLLLLLVATGAAAQAPPDCRDSIKCVQVQAFRTLRDLFQQERVRLGAGLEMVREGGGEARAARGGAEEAEALLLSPGAGVGEREEALEAFAVDGAVRFLRERTLRWDPQESAQALSRALAHSGAKIGEFLSQGRGKKILKAVIPILVGIKIKAVIVMVLTYLAIAFIAKKAILASLISLVISVVIGIRKLLDRQHQYPAHHVSTTHHVSSGHAEYVHPPVHASYHGASGPGYADSDHYGGDHYAAHSSPVAHVLAYGAQKPVGLR